MKKSHKSCQDVFARLTVLAPPLGGLRGLRGLAGAEPVDRGHSEAVPLPLLQIKNRVAGRVQLDRRVDPLPSCSAR